jgi:hypothetical protein
MDRETDQRHFGVWIALFVSALLIAYPLSMGPAIWLVLNVDLPDWLATCIDGLYTPVNLALEFGPGWLVDAFDRYLEFWDA